MPPGVEFVEFVEILDQSMTGKDSVCVLTEGVSVLSKVLIDI